MCVCVCVLCIFKLGFSFCSTFVCFASLCCRFLLLLLCFTCVLYCAAIVVLHSKERMNEYSTDRRLKPCSHWQVSCTSFLAPENLCKLHVHTTQVSSSRKWLYALEKSDLQSIVQSVAEFHDRNLPEIEHVIFRPVSGTSFLYQENGARNTVHTGKFLSQETCNRNLSV